MSVSFYPSIENNVPHVIQCVCSNKWQYNQGQVFPTRQAATEARAEKQAYKSDCENPYCDYAYVTPLVEEPEVQMSNHNSVDLLRVLGILTPELAFEDVCAGQMDADDFLGRVLVAQGLHVGVARPAEQSGIVYTPARDAEYVSQRLNQLREVAAWAIKNNRSITWS